MAPAPEFRPSVIQQMSPSAVRTGTASPRPSSPQPRPILGGELIVRVVCAKVRQLRMQCPLLICLVVLARSPLGLDHLQSSQLPLCSLQHLQQLLRRLQEAQ